MRIAGRQAFPGGKGCADFYRRKESLGGELARGWVREGGEDFRPIRCPLKRFGQTECKPVDDRAAQEANGQHVSIQGRGSMGHKGPAPVCTGRAHRQRTGVRSWRGRPWTTRRDRACGRPCPCTMIEIRAQTTGKPSAGKKKICRRICATGRSRGVR